MQSSKGFVSEGVIDPIYTNQKVKYTPNFKNKRERIRNQYDQFLQQPAAKVDVAAYLNQTAGHSYASMPGWIKPTTAFTNKRDGLLAQNAYCSIIGCRESFDIAQYQDHPAKTTMSMIHLLAIPKACIFNGVSLTRANVVILDQMIDLFKKSWPSATFREAVLTHQKQAIEQRYMNKSDRNRRDKEGYQLAIQHFEELRGYIGNLSERDFQFGLHLWPDNSIPHLHLHIVAMPWQLRQYSTMEHDAKTVDAIEVRDFILSR